ncbi:MAG: bifunctional hydroxymethylpyrimidine kinase/phosphomethylpyrimidine kinase [Eubacterium sp.]|nr:bifunctional hydroxymethylpyrimidine kinase/phosphomethylpyrimidine kinase [Eubacterium sp.]
MTRKAAVINDLSGMGRCSLVADISVLSAMGITANPVPTAILSAQTEYEGYYAHSCTEDLPHYLTHWTSMHASFDGILTGYLSDASQTAFVIQFLRQFKKDKTILLIDPVMGDDGFTYANFSEALLADMRHLAEASDILTPNITELCLLSGGKPAQLASMESSALMQNILGWAQSLLNKPGKAILVTGVPGALAQYCPDSVSISETGRKPSVSDGSFAHQIGNLLVCNDHTCLYLFPHRKGHFSGTGDLFAAAVLGGRLNGWSWEKTIKISGSFISAGVRDSIDAGTPFNDGIDYEQHLSMLFPDKTNKNAFI